MTKSKIKKTINLAYPKKKNPETKNHNENLMASTSLKTSLTKMQGKIYIKYSI
ncbi:MAG: hypothetical protein PF542_04325 [Nanoarchaeota archaeon]|jgi:hypothetical protein|nr:hypothetical protein [Nanoarchaeota archaeon]